MFGLAVTALGYHSGRPRIATNYVDPVGRLQAQDEAVYASSSIRMTTNGDWLTPRFLGRYALYKPPLLYWLSAAAMSLSGVSPAALRAPSVIAGALTVTAIFLWLWQAQTLAAGLAAALLLLSNRLFFTLARTATMDALLLLWTVLAVIALAMDPQLSHRRTAWAIGVFSGLAILTKAVAGVIPLIILGMLWAISARDRRPAFARLIETFTIAAAVALPWHLYQLAVHPGWFWNEYILTEHLALGLSSPQTSPEGHAWFYLRRFVITDPMLSLAAVISLFRLRHAPDP